MDISSTMIHFGLKSLNQSISLPPSALQTVPVADRPTVVETAMGEEARSSVRVSPLIGGEMNEPALGDHLGRNVDIRA